MIINLNSFKKILFVFAFGFITSSQLYSQVFQDAWHDSIQQVPGIIQCEFYNLGGEGVAYHDTDSVNNGSGKLNPANGNWLNEFRIHEGVDISYTKTDDIDNNAYNLVQPLMQQLYVGWTVPGEWINYTIKVNKTAEYSIDIMYTSNSGGSISFDIDGKKLTDEIKIPSTYNASDTIAWRQWHHWNRLNSFATVKLKKGIHTLTLRTTLVGNMNYDFVEFRQKN